VHDSAVRDDKTMEIDEEWLVPTVDDAHALAFAPGSYRLCFEIASGGMATVYLALYEGPANFEKVVAVKTIHEHLGKEQRFLDMFLDEARIAANIEHPYVARVLDFGQAQESWYLAMEYVDGEALSEVFDRLVEDPELASSLSRARLVARVIADLAVSESLQHCLSHRTCPRTRAHLRFAAVAGVYSYQIGRLSGSARTASLLPGLMHDIGKPIATTLLSALKELPEWGLTDEAIEILAEEMHIPVGLRLVREWNLPRPVETAIRFHKDLHEAPEGSQEAHIAHLATLFADWTFDPEGAEGNLHAELEVVRALGLGEEQLESLFGNLDEALEAAHAFA